MLAALPVMSETLVSISAALPPIEVELDAMPEPLVEISLVFVVTWVSRPDMDVAFDEIPVALAAIPTALVPVAAVLDEMFVWLVVIPVVLESISVAF